MNVFKFYLVVAFLMVALFSSCVADVENHSNKNEGEQKLMCEVTGTCILCRKDELDSDYCRETGRRIRIRCKDSKEEFDDFKSCSKTADDDQIQVILFQVVMGLIGGLAYWGVQKRKKNTMSLFDHRKLRYVILLRLLALEDNMSFVFLYSRQTV